MKFEPHYISKADLAFRALEFLRDAYERGLIGEIENMDDVFDALDIAQDLEYAHQRLDQYHIEY